MKSIKINKKELSKAVKKDKKKVGKIPKLNPNRFEELSKVSQVTESKNKNYALNFYIQSLLK